MILCDAGVLLCLVDRTQPQHKAYKSSVLRLAKPLVTTWSCLTEVDVGWALPPISSIGRLLPCRVGRAHPTHCLRDDAPIVKCRCLRRSRPVCIGTVTIAAGWMIRCRAFGAAANYFLSQPTQAFL